MEASNKGASGFMRLVAIIVSIAMICAGSFMFFRPISIVVVFSAAVLAFGIQQIINYVFARGGARNGWDIIGGVINISFGAIMLFGGTPERVFGVLAIEIYIGFWAIFAGITNFCGSFGLKKQGVKGWYWSLIGGILTAICGFMLVSRPLMGAIVLIEVLGIYAGLMFLITGFTGLAAALSGGGKEAAELPAIEEEKR